MTSVTLVADVNSAYRHDPKVEYTVPRRLTHGTRSLEEWDLQRPNLIGSPHPSSAILDLLDPYMYVEAESVSRATKRRKLDSGVSTGIESAEEFDGSKSIVLARVSINLAISTSTSPPQKRSISPTQPRKPIVVSLEQFSQLSDHEFRFTLWNSQAPTAGVDFIATTTTSVNTIEPHLETVRSELCTTTNGRQRAKKPGASFCRSVLRSDENNQDMLALDIEIRWLLNLSVMETMNSSSPMAKRDSKLLARYLRDSSKQSITPWSLSDFYDSVHVPPQDLKIAPPIERSLVETTLYPFQQRAVDWLLRREAVEFSATPELKQVDSPTSHPVSFRPVQDAQGRKCFVSDARGLVVLDPNVVIDGSNHIRGGILAEEMGLGKTVEVIALINHHKRAITESSIFDRFTGMTVKPSGATLIITPPSILEQWKNEINTHAPELKVLHYKGLPPTTAPKKAHEAATVEYLMRYDVVLTTYAVLSREVHFAKPPPDRSLRGKKRHAPRRSPLVEISWWRVCLDEAQMVESGVSQAATVARLIPRCNAWAVSGTPLSKNVHDLRGLLLFLRYEPFASNKAVWDRLDQASFRELFGQIALRHSKDRIRDELRLPPQKRVVITMPFTAIEEQNYSELIQQMCNACGLSPEGVPLDGDRDFDDAETVERMREWLIRLRQTCLHAHVGKKNRRALGAKSGPLRTVHDVLEVMIEQNDTSLKAEARENILAQLRCGHVKGNAKDNEKRSETALPFYEQALKEAQIYVEICRKELALEKERLGSTGVEIEQDADEEELDGQNMGRIPTLRKSLRSFLELEHACMFFVGTVHFQIKSNENLVKADSEDFYRLEKLEVEWYDKAKQVRRELLRESQNRAQQHMKKISARKPFHQIAKVKDLDDLGGIESKKILEMMDSIADALNAQAKQLQVWREKVAHILLLPLVDEDEEGKETTGDEYEDSTKVQDELYVFIMALRTLVADRSAIITGLQDILVEHELKEAEKDAIGRDEEGPKGHAPELVLEVIRIRRQLKVPAAGESLKGAISGVRSLITSLQWRADGGDGRAASELSIAQKHLAAILDISNDQTETVKELEKEQDMFRGAMNQRLEFYRQLQHISDTVAPWREELDETFDAPEFKRQETKKTETNARLRGCKTKHSYLTNLRKENEHADVRHDCIICQDSFEIGVLTTCGHKYCKDCINHWWHAHRTCPLCKMTLRKSDFKDINFKPSEIKAQEETHNQEESSQGSSPSSSGTSIYSDISDSVMREIKTIDLDSSYGTKIDMIGRHLLWIRNNDPGAKSIIFSQFGDFLDVLREALKKWKIGSSSIRERKGIDKFLADPSVDCFLLDAKSDSSGLNLVNATYVFLCEPLINPAIELQAIARVHRIGQRRATTVFMYLVSDTVEEAIYDISVGRRLEHMGRGSSKSGTATPVLQEKTLDAANSMELEAAPVKQLLRKKGDGEIVPAADLWSCLFGKAKKQQRVVLDTEVARHMRAKAAEERIGAEVDRG